MSDYIPLRVKKNNLDKGTQGRAAERSITKRLSGRAQPGSGAMPSAKGDVLFSINDYNFLGENKSSTTESFSVKRAHLLKIYQEALETYRIPVLTFQFVNQQGKSDKKDRWLCIPEHLLKELLED